MVLIIAGKVCRHSPIQKNRRTDAKYQKLLGKSPSLSSKMPPTRHLVRCQLPDVTKVIRQPLPKEVGAYLPGTLIDGYSGEHSTSSDLANITLFRLS